MLGLTFAWWAGAAGRLAAVFSAVWSLAWAAARLEGRTAPSAAALLHASAPLALAWWAAAWRAAGGPLALLALGRRPARAGLVAWCAVAPAALVHPEPPPASPLTVAGDRLSHPDLTVHWTAAGARRADTAQLHTRLPAPTAAAPPSPLPWPLRPALHLSAWAGLLTWTLARARGLAPVLLAAAATFTAAQTATALLGLA